MTRLLFPALLIALLIIVGCNDSPTRAPDNEWMINPPIEVSSNTVYVPADAGMVELLLYNRTDAVLNWSIGMAASSSVDWIDLLVTDEDAQPGDSTLLGIRVDRSGIGPGFAEGEIELHFDGEVVQIVAVTMQTGTPDAEPIGVYTNFLRIPATVDHVTIGLVNNSEESWGAPTMWPGHAMLPDFLTEWPYTQHVVIEPGGEGVLDLMVDRGFMQPGTHGGVIVLSWYGVPVQTINVELEVGE